MIRALIVLADGFEEIEAVTPIDLMRRAGIAVTVAGLSSLLVTSKRKLVVQCEVLLADCGGDFEAILLPGGLPGAQFLADSPEIQTRVREQFSQGGLVAAICAAPATVLGPLGLLNNRTWSGYPGTEREGWGGRYSNEACTVDGQLVTARGAGTAMQFALAVVEQLCGKKVAERVGLEITWA